MDFIWLTVLRLLGGLAVLVAPLPALWFAGHLDRWDWSLLGMPAASEHQQHVYQYWDKSLDTFTLAMACIVALRWKDPIVRRLAIATFAWRVAGVAIFMATGHREVLVAFPNVFERLFFFYLVFRLLSRQEVMLRGRADAVLLMVALTLPKVADEYFVHVATRPWQTMHLLPAALSTPDHEYWMWMPIMVALPALAMVGLLFRDQESRAGLRLPGALASVPIPHLAAGFVRRQAARVPGIRLSVP